jgi:hypothetical protein
MEHHQVDILSGDANSMNFALTQTKGIMLPTMLLLTGIFFLILMMKSKPERVNLPFSSIFIA